MRWRDVGTDRREVGAFQWGRCLHLFLLSIVASATVWSELFVHPLNSFGNRSPLEDDAQGRGQSSSYGCRIPVLFWRFCFSKPFETRFSRSWITKVSSYRNHRRRKVVYQLTSTTSGTNVMVVVMVYINKFTKMNHVQRHRKTVKPQLFMREAETTIIPDL